MENGYARAEASKLPGVGAYRESRSLTEALDNVLGATRRRWNKARGHVGPATVESADSAKLREAFHVFVEAADRLEGTYSSLRSRVEELSSQLALANGELTRQLQDKQSLAERQAALLAALPAGVLVVDTTGLVREANAVALELFGLDLVGKHWHIVKASFTSAGTPFEWLTNEGCPRRLNVQEVTDERGGRIVLLNDITEAHAARVLQERNERLATMGEMTARVAHQLRTPLATAMLYASQLERGDLTQAERAGLGDRILSRLRSLERVSREMLRFVRGERANEQSIEVSALLSEAAQVMEPLMAARGIAFVCEDHTAGAILLGDRRGLAAALLSLLENAAQATSQGGKVRICGMANSLHVRIQVSDSGSGIAHDVLPHLFEPFYSTRVDGTGLGLAIVKSVVEAHGGSIDVDSSEHTGTSFTITLPCSNEARPAAVSASACSRDGCAGAVDRPLNREAA